MSTFIDRLIIEIDELEEKRIHLESFLFGETFNSLSRTDQDLLSTQYTIMLSYLQILNLRFHLANLQTNNLDNTETTNL